jgi:PilZ domain
MSTPKIPATQGADWTNLLTDPDLVSNLGKLLQVYREAPFDKRDEALLSAMREIKEKAQQESGSLPQTGHGPEPQALSVETTPPFEPNLFTPSWADDRRKYPRVKCFVAVELRTEGSETPVWGNLSNTSLGGCYVETATPVKPGAQLEIGLWVASGKIWVKGLILTGTVTQSKPTYGIRVKFGGMETAERESLRQFLKFVESTTQGYQKENGYLARLKR